jgi:hypothetical protein
MSTADTVNREVREGKQVGTCVMCLNYCRVCSAVQTDTISSVRLSTYKLRICLNTLFVSSSPISVELNWHLFPDWPIAFFFKRICFLAAVAESSSVSDTCSIFEKFNLWNLIGCILNLNLECHLKEPLQPVKCITTIPVNAVNLFWWINNILYRMFHWKRTFLKWMLRNTTYISRDPPCIFKKV